MTSTPICPVCQRPTTAVTRTREPMLRLCEPTTTGRYEGEEWTRYEPCGHEAPPRHDTELESVTFLDGLTYAVAHGGFNEGDTVRVHRGGQTFYVTAGKVERVSADTQKDPIPAECGMTTPTVAGRCGRDTDHDGPHRSTGTTFSAYWEDQ